MVAVLRRNVAFGGVLVLLLAIGMIAGCGNDGLEKVTGVVTLDGQPLENAQIEFIPTGETGSSAYGRTDSDGEFVLEFSGSSKGAMPGEYQVGISTYDVADPDNNIPAKDEVVPKKYRGDGSELIRTVKEGEKNHFEFELTSEGSEVEQPKNVDEG